MTETYNLLKISFVSRSNTLYNIIKSTYCTRINKNALNFFIFVLGFLIKIKNRGEPLVVVDVA